jgi:hypothetical protein
MSYRIVREVRAALKTGRIVLTGKTGPLDRLVLILLADDARDDTRVASVGMRELSGITGVHRNTIGKSIGRLEKAASIRASRGGRDPDGQRKAGTYQFPPDFGCTPQGSASNSKLDAPLAKLDAPLEPVGCTPQDCALPGSTPGTTPGELPPNHYMVGGAQPSSAQPDNDESGFGSQIDREQARKIAGRFIRQLWPPDLDPETLAVAIGICVRYLTSSTEKDGPEERQAILYDALAYGSNGANIPHKLWDDIADAKSDRRW